MGNQDVLPAGFAGFSTGSQQPSEATVPSELYLFVFFLLRKTRSNDPREQIQLLL